MESKAPAYRKFTIQKRKLRAIQKPAGLAQNAPLRLSLTLEARELGMNLTDYLEYIGYEPVQKVVAEEGFSPPEDALLYDEEPSEDD